MLPLEQLWARLAPVTRQELLAHLTRLVAQRWTPPVNPEDAHE
jgi:hypothetical protein